MWRYLGIRPQTPFLRGPPQATTIFELPPDEIQLMREVTNEIQKARRWATFDAIFGRLVLRKAQFFFLTVRVQKWPSKEEYKMIPYDVI